MLTLQAPAQARRRRTQAVEGQVFTSEESLAKLLEWEEHKAASGCGGRGGRGGGCGCRGRGAAAAGGAVPGAGSMDQYVRHQVPSAERAEEEATDEPEAVG